MPSAGRPCFVCQVLVVAAVPGPNFPSVATPMIFCQRTTSGPLEPCLSMARLAAAGGEAGAGATAVGMGAGASGARAAGTAGVAVGATAGGGCFVATAAGVDTVTTGVAVTAAAQVIGPTTPSGVIPCCDCQVFV